MSARIVTTRPSIPAARRPGRCRGPGPVPNQPPIGQPRARRHERDEDQLRDRPDQERGQRRRGQLDALGEAEDPALPLVGTTLCRMVCSDASAYGHQQHVDGHARRQQDHRGLQREQAGDAPKTTLTSSSSRNGFLPRPVLATARPPMMKTGAQRAPQQPPGLHRHQMTGRTRPSGP